MADRQGGMVIFGAMAAAWGGDVRTFILHFDVLTSERHGFATSMSSIHVDW
jgi:hypothetical protein